MSVILKLISPDGIVLGSIGVRKSIADEIERYQSARIMFPEPLRWILYSPEESQRLYGVMKTAILARNFSSDTCVEGVVLLGVTIEEFEMIPECWFTPGAAYIREMVDKAVARNVPAPPASEGNT